MATTNVGFQQFEEQPYAVNGTGNNKAQSVVGQQPLDFVHYTPPSRSADEWAPDNRNKTPPPTSHMSANETPPLDSINALKRKRGRPPKGFKEFTKEADGSSLPSTTSKDHLLAESSTIPPAEVMDVDETLTRVHSAKRLRTFDFVVFDQWKIKPWYFSPYPLIDIEPDELLTMATSRAQPNGVANSATSQRATAKTHDHEKTAELLASSAGKSENGESLLWVCHFCFKYMSDGIPWELHKKDCKMKSPPGKKVYQRGAHIIWEVDGSKEKLYCQNLSLFGKLFIDVKTLFFDCDNFMFYILTDAKSSEDHIIGFFSKEKVSYDDCNLACILTLPQYQRKGYGMLMIEFSYELSRREGKIGSPERPLSQLGLRGYLSYWISTLVRFFRRVLSTLSPEIATVRNRNAFPSLRDGDDVGDDVELMKDIKIPKRKSTKGFDGEISEASIEARLCTMPLKYIQGLKDPMFSTQRIFETKRQEDGSAVTHVKVECSLADISRATYIKEQDVAFALNEIGLLSRRLKAHADHQDNGDNGSETPEETTQIRIEDTIVITRSMIEQVAKERNVKIMILDRACVLV